MSLKRNSQCGSVGRSQQKRAKTVPNFVKLLQESGLTIKSPPDKCVASNDVINIEGSLKKILQNHYDYPRNVSDFISSFENDCNNMDHFRHYLFPNIIRSDENSEHQLSDSVMRILLKLPILQPKLIDLIFEKATDLAAENQCQPFIQMILKCFTTINNTVSPDIMSKHLFDLLHVTSENMVRLEIIIAFPDIIGDQEHENVALELSKFLHESQELIPAILDCLSYLCLGNAQYQQLQREILNILFSQKKYSYFPNFVKFLLMPGYANESGYLETIQGLRNTLDWPTSGVNMQEIATSQVLSASTIRNSIISSKVVANSWFKVLSSCKIHTDLKPFDFIILLIMYTISTKERQRQVENFLKKNIKSDILKVSLLQESFIKFKPVIKEYLEPLTELINTLLMSPDHLVELFGSHIYILMFSELEESRQRLVAELLQLGLDRKQCVMNTLCLLNKIAEKDIAMLKPQSLQILTLLDRTDNLNLNEIRETIKLVCKLAYSFENSIIRDDVHMIIRKQLGSSKPFVKIQGILAGVYGVKNLMVATTDEAMVATPDDVSYSSITHLKEGPVKEAARIIELISRSTRQFPHLISFFYDELSNVISSSPYVNKQFLSWLTDAVTNDLQCHFLVNCVPVMNSIFPKLSMQYSLNLEGEVDEMIAINIAGLLLNPNDDINIEVLSPLFQLVQTLHSKLYDGDLSSIDALLGAPIIMPEFDINLCDEMNLNNVHSVVNCLIHCVNWFRELLNGFCNQKDETLSSYVFLRISHIDDIEKLITQILLTRGSSYKPPVCNYNKCIAEYCEKKTKLPLTNPVAKQRVNDDTLLETGRSQVPGTQNHTVKGTLDNVHNLPLRPLGLDLIKLLDNNISTDKNLNLKLNIKTFKFLLKNVINKLESCLNSNSKRKTFPFKPDPNIYDASKAEICAKNINNVLPNLISNYKIITEHIQSNITMPNELELADYLSSVEYFYILMNSYFKWFLYRDNEKALLQTSLQAIIKSEENISKLPIKDLLVRVAKFFHSHEKLCIQISTGVCLLGLLKTIHHLSDNIIILKLLRETANNFLSIQWKTIDGLLEKGLYFNQNIDQIACTLFTHIDIVELKNTTSQLAIESELVKVRNGNLPSFKCFNKSNFPILYKNIATSIHNTAKKQISKGLTDSEMLILWTDVALILKNMTDIAKIVENRRNLSAFLKKSLLVFKLFLSQGMPMMEILFRHNKQDVLDIFIKMQQTTRFLQTLCCHSRLKKDMALMAKVPEIRHILESFLYKVKAVLAANNLSEAFWMGNLKNKNLNGEVISSQESIEESITDNDDDNLLPLDDDSDEIDAEFLNTDSNHISDII